LAVQYYEIPDINLLGIGFNNSTEKYLKLHKYLCIPALKNVQKWNSVHSWIQNEHDGCPIQKWAIFVLIKAAQGFSVPAKRDRKACAPVRRSRKPAENAEQDKKGHLWMDTN